MNVVHHYKVFIFLIFGIFCKIFLFSCAVSGFFLLTAQGKLLTAHAIGTPQLKGSGCHRPRSSRKLYSTVEIHNVRFKYGTANIGG